jgi:hypothetical protein
MSMKNAEDWKAKYEWLEDRGRTPDLIDFVRDIQEDVIKATLKKAKQQMTKVLSYESAD